MSYELDFEAPVAQLTGELERLQRSDGHEDQIDAIERDIEQQLRELYEVRPRGRPSRLPATGSGPTRSTTRSSCSRISSRPSR